LSLLFQLILLFAIIVSYAINIDYAFFAIFFFNITLRHMLFIDYGVFASRRRVAALPPLRCCHAIIDILYYTLLVDAAPLPRHYVITTIIYIIVGFRLISSLLIPHISCH